VQSVHGPVFRDELSFHRPAGREFNIPALSEHEYTAVIRWRRSLSRSVRRRTRVRRGRLHYLGRQMIHGARSVAFRVAGRDDGRSKWLQSLVLRRGCNRAVVALANKTARIAWAAHTPGDLQGSLRIIDRKARLYMRGVLMARRTGPQLPKPDRLQGPRGRACYEGGSSGSHQGQEHDCFKNRPDRFPHRMPPNPTKAPCAGGVHRV
jgi:hypothetical protein